MKELIIKAIYGKAKQYAFGPYDDPTEEDIDDVCDSLYEFCSGMKVLASKSMRNFIEEVGFIYTYELRSGNKYDGDNIDDSFPHLYKEGSRR